MEVNKLAKLKETILFGFSMNICLKRRIVSRLPTCSVFFQDVLTASFRRCDNVVTTPKRGRAFTGLFDIS